MSSKALARFWRDEDGFASFETMWSIPILMVVIVMGIFLHQTVTNRAEVVIATRTSAMNEALNKSCSQTNSILPDLTQILSSRSVSCSKTNAEAETPQRLKFWPGMRNAASPFPAMIDDVRLNRVDAVRADGRARLENLEVKGAPVGRPIEVRTQNIVPTSDFWRHHDEPWRRGYDRRIFNELGRAQPLFETVFPAR